MMIPSTMILTIMYFNSAETYTVVYHWTLGLVMRQQNTKLITLIVTLVLLDLDKNIFGHQCGGHLQPVGGGLNPPTLRQIERWSRHTTFIQSPRYVLTEGLYCYRSGEVLCCHSLTTQHFPRKTCAHIITASSL